MPRSSNAEASASGRGPDRRGSPPSQGPGRFDERVLSCASLLPQGCANRDCALTAQRQPRPHVPRARCHRLPRQCGPSGHHRLCPWAGPARGLGPCLVQSSSHCTISADRHPPSPAGRRTTLRGSARSVRPAQASDPRCRQPGASDFATGVDANLPESHDPAASWKSTTSAALPARIVRPVPLRRPQACHLKQLSTSTSFEDFRAQAWRSRCAVAMLCCEIWRASSKRSRMVRTSHNHCVVRNRRPCMIRVC